MGRDRRLDVGGIIFGLILLGVGAWYLLRNTFGLDLPELQWDMLWPVLIIAVGLGIVWRAWDRQRAKD